MTDVVLGQAGSTVVVDLDVCAKSGRTTDELMTLRGRTTPAWVTVLLLFTVVGFLLAGAMTSRSSSVTLPYVHDVYRRWKRNKGLAWVVGLGGIAALVVAATSSGDAVGLWGIAGVTLVVAALVGGTVNAMVNGVGLRMTRDGDLVLVRAHPAFAQAVAEARVESTTTIRR